MMKTNKLFLTENDGVRMRKMLNNLSLYVS